MASLLHTPCYTTIEFPFAPFNTSLLHMHSMKKVHILQEPLTSLPPTLSWQLFTIPIQPLIKH